MMTEISIAAIVEGHGECEAVPVLLRRIARELDPGFVPRVLKPIRVPAARLLKPGELERAIELAARKLHGRGGIIVLVDCDWGGGCPAREGPALLERARQSRSDLLISIVLAKSEFESWFIAAAESLRGRRHLAADLQRPPAPEDIRGAKEWLSARMTGGSGYSETDDQPALTEVFDFAAARQADSFDKCYREVERMLKTLKQSTGPF